jgi:hypothetical protein
MSVRRLAGRSVAELRRECLILSRRQAATTAGVPTDHARVCLGAPTWFWLTIAGFALMAAGYAVKGALWLRARRRPTA